MLEISILSCLKFLIFNKHEKNLWSKLWCYGYNDLRLSLSNVQRKRGMLLQLLSEYWLAAQPSSIWWKCTTSLLPAPQHAIASTQQIVIRWYMGLFPSLSFHTTSPLEIHFLNNIHKSLNELEQRMKHNLKYLCMYNRQKKSKICI